MKKKCGFAGYFTFFMILAFALAAVVHARGVNVATTETRLYFVDTEMLRLIPVRVTIPDGTTEKKAQRVLDELVKGRDDNPKIRRLIPNISHCLTARVEDETVYVNISSKMVENHPKGRDLELLTVYQIVNSLTEIDGVKVVRFTINGSVERHFMGYLDMRETFVPDYFI